MSTWTTACKSWAYETGLTEKGKSVNKNWDGGQCYASEFKNVQKCKKQVLWALSISATVLRKISTEVLKCWLYAGKHIRKHHENILVRKMAQMIFFA